MKTSWWRQMETFSALLALCLGNWPATSEFTAQRPATRSFDVFFDLRLIKQFNKQSRRWWFETPSGPLWRQCNAFIDVGMLQGTILLIWIQLNFSMDKQSYPFLKCGMTYLIIHSQTPMAAPLVFGKGYMISCHTLLGIGLHIHAGIKVNPC